MVTVSPLGGASEISLCSEPMESLLNFGLKYVTVCISAERTLNECWDWCEMVFGMVVHIIHMTLKCQLKNTPADTPPWPLPLYSAMPSEMRIRPLWKNFTTKVGQRRQQPFVSIIHDFPTLPSQTKNYCFGASPFLCTLYKWGWTHSSAYIFILTLCFELFCSRPRCARIYSVVCGTPSRRINKNAL